MNEYENPFNCSPIDESVPKVQVLVVDDDPSCLDFFMGLLNMLNYQVTPARDPFEALNILQMKEVSFDFVIADIYMPLMNGVVLQQKIEDDFSIPVVLMSEVSDKQKLAAETGLQEGAIVMSKPPVVNQVQNLWRFILIRMKAKNNFKGKKPKQGQSAEIDLEKLNVNNKNEDPSDIDARKRANPKTKLVWTPALHNRFLDAIKAIGYDRAVPKKIMEHMNVRGLNRAHISSHLQKYRIHMKRIYDACMKIEEYGVPLDWNQMSSLTYNEFPDLVHNTFLLNYATAMFMKELEEDISRTRFKRRRAVTQFGQNYGMPLLGNSTNTSGYGIGLSPSLAPPSSQGLGSLYTPYQPISPLVTPISSNGTIGATSGVGSLYTPYRPISPLVSPIPSNGTTSTIGATSGVGSLYTPYQPIAPLVSPIPSNGTNFTIGATSGANYYHNIFGNRMCNNNVPWYMLESNVPNLGGNGGANGGASVGTQGQAVAQGQLEYAGLLQGCLGNNGTGTQPQNVMTQGPFGYAGLHGGGPSNGMGMGMGMAMDNNGVLFATPYQGIGSHHQFNGNVPYYPGGTHNFTNGNNMMQRSSIGNMPSNFIGQSYGAANYMPTYMNQHLGTNFMPHTTPVPAMPTSYVASSSTDPTTTRLSNFPTETSVPPVGSRPNFTLPNSFVSPMGEFFNLSQQPFSKIATMINLSKRPTTPLGALWNCAAQSSSEADCGPPPVADLSDFAEQPDPAADVVDISDDSEQAPSDVNVPNSVDEQPDQPDVADTLSVEQPPLPVAAATSNMPNSVAQQTQIVSDNSDNLSNISSGNQHVVTFTEQLAVANQESNGSSASNDQPDQEMEGYGFNSETSNHLENWLSHVYGDEYSMDPMDAIAAYLNNDPQIDDDIDTCLGEY